VPVRVKVRLLRQCSVGLWRPGRQLVESQAVAPSTGRAGAHGRDPCVICISFRASRLVVILAALSHEVGMAAFKVRLEDGSEMGPLDMEMLRSWYHQGLVTRGSKVRRTNGKQWVPRTDAVDISAWGGAGATKGHEAEAEEEVEEYSDDPQRWRIFLASVLFFLVAAGAGYFAMFPDRWIPALKEAPWREIALGQVVIALLLVTGSDMGRKVARVLVFLLTFSLFWILAGAAGIGYLGFVPPGTAASSVTVANAGQSAPDDRLAAPWSPSAT